MCLCQKRLRLSSVVDECKPLPSYTKSTPFILSSTSSTVTFSDRELEIPLRSVSICIRLEGEEE